MLRHGLQRAAVRSLQWPVSPLWGAWLEAARAWGDLARGTSSAWMPEPGLLLELASGLARAFAGRRFAAPVAGQTLRAELQSVAVERRGMGHGGRLDMRDVEFDGVTLDAVSIRAEEVSLTAQPQTRLLLSDLEIRGSLPAEPLLARLAAGVPGWTIRVAEHGMIEAGRWGSRHRLLLDAEVSTSVLTVYLRGVRLRGLTVRCPSWMRLTRAVRLPDRPDGLTVAEAIRRGEDVHFRLSMPALVQPFDLARLSRAIALAAADGDPGRRPTPRGRAAPRRGPEPRSPRPPATESRRS